MTPQQLRAFALLFRTVAKTECISKYDRQQKTYYLRIRSFEHPTDPQQNQYKNVYHPKQATLELYYYTFR